MEHSISFAKMHCMMTFLVVNAPPTTLRISSEVFTLTEKTVGPCLFVKLSKSVVGFWTLYIGFVWLFLQQISNALAYTCFTPRGE
jgi:hypothetical protein